MTRAVVFAYHNVGVRCLQVLLAAGVEVALVVTHTDDPREQIWFSSVAGLCAQYGLPCIAPADVNDPAVVAQVAALAPDFLFSFYYRQLLQAPLLAIPTRGAYNMHGSLLPQFRGRAPVNWAVLHGARITGATLHQMNTKPDNGPIVGQQAVPILPDDTAHEVFAKVTVAAEMCLYQCLPYLLEGKADHRPQDLTLGGYFGGRRPEDGRIDWHQPARVIHNLVRAVSYPYPGAFADLPLGRLVLWQTRVLAEDGYPPQACCLQLDEQQRWVIYTTEGGLLQVLAGELDGRSLAEPEIARALQGRIRLSNPA
ncbi:formyltransferase [Chitinibacter tainanensis]|uniref:formyltransferase n=1 Tax=Chitinibacter tainanensis TaxID=230667 RepID=UPI000411AC16|nr:formyltransferase [Chitinibacter tainanensis]